MSYDGAFTHAMSIELNQQIKGGQVTKINQPYPNEIIMMIRSHHRNYPLLLSANPNYARVQITNLPYINPPTPTTFVMTLRKYLKSGTLIGIQQMTNDRVLRFHFMSRNELGDLEHLILIVEIMARHSNIILVDSSDMTIIDAVKRIGKEKNRYRQILPGFKYIQPPKQTSINPFRFNQFDQLTAIVKKFPNQDVLAHHLQHLVQGLGRKTAQELAQWLHQSGSLEQNFKQFFWHYSHPQPTLTQTDRGKIDFSVYNFSHDSRFKTFHSLSQLLDHYYNHRAERDRVREKGAALIKVARNELKKNRRKQKKLKKTYWNSQRAGEDKLKGELLTTYMYKIKSGMNQIKLPNFYHPNQTVTIKLSYDRTPSENAQWYFKQYRKKQHASVFVKQQLKASRAEVNYFQNIMSQIELAEPSDLDDIKLELERGGYLKNHNNNPKRNRKMRLKLVSRPKRFQADDGSLIYVGKNNLQNDRLTFKIADKRDTWFHTKQIHGSHVIIKNFKPSDKDIEQAATLAAYFSKGRDSANVPVDYVKVKHVKKPNGAKPGFVIFRGQRTIYVTPEAKSVNHLRNNFKHRH